MRIRFLIFLPLLFVSQTPPVVCPSPDILSFQVVKVLYRDQPGFTEGLEWHDGAIWESTGNLFGNTHINRIDPETGHVTTLVNAGKDYFGEGLTFSANRIYQMTWREHKVFVFDPLFQHHSGLSNPREGWGLTHSNSDLIASDGSDTLFFLSPRDFKLRHTLKVTVSGKPLSLLNELEWVKGEIWANVFGSWKLARISPATGCVTALVDFRPLLKQMNRAERRAILSEANFVLNGIAYDPAGNVLIVTGKYWPSLFLSVLQKRPQPPPSAAKPPSQTASAKEWNRSRACARDQRDEQLVPDRAAR